MYTVNLCNLGAHLVSLVCHTPEEFHNDVNLHGDAD